MEINKASVQGNDEVTVAIQCSGAGTAGYQSYSGCKAGLQVK